MPSTQVCMFCRYRGAPRQDEAGTTACPHGRSARLDDEAGRARDVLPGAGRVAPRHEHVAASVPRVNP